MSQIKQTVYALHGFLGQSEDWSRTFEKIDGLDVRAPSFFKDSDFAEFSFGSFLRSARKSRRAGAKNIFIGYSLGGRIGLRLLEADPHLFDHYVFISTHPGLIDDEERRIRIESDRSWADRLKTLRWSDFLRDWNQQVVLKSEVSPQRLESNFIRDRLETSLEKFSLGQQKDYSELIRKHQNKVTWIVGERDTKFKNLAVHLEQKKILLQIKRISSGHRILFENPKELSAALEESLCLI